MIVEHIKGIGPGDYQTFRLRELGDTTEAHVAASCYAWAEVGYEAPARLDKLSNYKRAKYHAAYNQALKVGSTKMAFKSEAVKWLIKQDIEFDVWPGDWTLEVGNGEVDVTINDDKDAMLFKLTWCNA